MDILIGIGVAAMFAAMCVMYYKWTFEVHARIGVELDNHRLRNDLHNAINIRKAKSRGITGKYRKAIEAHKAETIKLVSTGGVTAIDQSLWSVLDSEAPNA